MEIKDILLFLEAGQPCAARLAVGAALAHGHGATLTALCACPEPPMDPADGYVIGPEAVGDALAHREAAIARLLAPTQTAFREAVAGGEIEAVWTSAPPNETPLQLAMQARSYDLAIALRPSEGGRPGRRLAELTALASGTPCLAIPEEAPPPALFDRIILAWNGSREAKRALEDGLIFLKRAKCVRVLVVNGDPEQAEADKQIVRHLARHGVEAGLERVHVLHEDDGSALLRQCAQFGADLLVMGAYGHSRIAELILGGATRTVLAEATLPVLMSH
jgi:nucleotide-binding universal stress UspA family protein